MNRNSKSMNFAESNLNAGNNSTFNKTGDSNVISNTVTINSNQNNNDFSSKIKLEINDISNNNLLTKKNTFMINKNENPNTNISNISNNLYNGNDIKNNTNKNENTGNTNTINNSNNNTVNILTKEEIEQRKQALNKKFLEEKSKKIVENSGVEKFSSIADRIKLVEKHFSGSKNEDNVENGSKIEESSSYDKPIIKKKLKSRPNINFE